jgi:hypothetical protein
MKKGTLETRDVNARFVNGKPEAIESIYIMKSPRSLGSIYEIYGKIWRNKWFSFY